jgi:mono/diheme cytochrome c family protein
VIRCLEFGNVSIVDFLLKWRRYVLLAGFWATLLTGCAARGVSPSPEITSGSISGQLARGKDIYIQNCATEQCHGADGEGLRIDGTFRVWPLIGAEFQARNPDAQVIFDVVRSGSEANLRALTDQQIYDAIAHELHSNGVSLETSLADQNAANLGTGPAGGKSDWGRIYPPPGNAVLLSPPPAPGGLPQAGNGLLELRLDQLALASTIAGTSPPDGGIFAILVFAFRDLSDQPIDLEAKFLSLGDSLGHVHNPVRVNLDYPIEQFHDQTIRPGYGTAAVAVFALPVGAEPNQFIYDDQSGHPIALSLQ